MQTLHWIDWVIIGVVTLSTLASLWRGFVKEAFSLVAWVAAFTMATAFSAVLAGQLSGVVGNDMARAVAAWVLLFIGTLIVMTLITSMVAKLVRAAGLSGIDRVLGMAFGFTRGLVVVLAILYVTQAVVPVKQQSFMAGSVLVPQLEQVLVWVDTNIADLPAIHLPKQLPLPQSNDNTMTGV